MSKTILVFGHGPGISDAVARRFGKEGYAVGLVARNAERLAAAAKSLEGAGITAKAFPCDVGDPDAVRALVREARGALGPIAIVHWNAYAGVAGDLLTASSADLRKVLDVGVVGLVAAVQESLADLKAQQGSVLITGGAFAFYDRGADGAAVQFQAMGLAVAKAAQHKLSGLLHARLAAEGVYAGEVVVAGMVKGTAFDFGNATLEAPAIAEKFFELHSKRAESSVVVS